MGIQARRAGTRRDRCPKNLTRTQESFWHLGWEEENRKIDPEEKEPQVIRYICTEKPSLRKRHGCKPTAVPFPHYCGDCKCLKQDESEIIQRAEATP